MGSGSAAVRPPAAIPAAPAITASDTPAHFRPLLGEWLRPDGGYVLSVTGVEPDGRAAVAYWYQTLPSPRWPALETYAERVKHLDLPPEP